MNGDLIPRAAAPLLRQLAGQFRTVTLQGPRQSGKTTLARATFPDYRYVNLEDLRSLQLAEEDQTAFFAANPPPLIIDEIQLCPSLLRGVQVIVDERGRPGDFILTGSHQPLLRQGICESLAGRTTILDILPLSLAELAAAGIAPSRGEAIWRGFMPQLHQQPTLPPSRFYQAYYQTYVERDVRRLINLREQSSFLTFMRLLAGRVGQLLNLSALANDIGVSAHTLDQWLTVLEASYVVFRLRPYHANLRRRLTRAPKIYFTEPGLAAALLGIADPTQAETHPAFGGLFENVVITELLKTIALRQPLAEPLFYRDATGNEVDLLICEGQTLRAFEIKSALTPHPAFSKTLHALPSLIQRPIAQSAVIYGGDNWGPPDLPYVNFLHAATLLP